MTIPDTTLARRGPRPSQRAQAVAPFWVMQVAEEAAALARDPAPGAPRLLKLNIGEPDVGAPEAVRAAAEQVLRAGRTAYTPALGIEPLRAAIADWYRQRWGLAVDPRRIAVTAGASAALQLASLALFDVGDEVLLPDPCYPCNRQILTSLGVQATLLPTTAATRYQPSAGQIEAAWGARTRGVMLASPSNPTGTAIAPAALHAALQAVRRRGGALVVDEIYLGLTFDAHAAQPALALGEDVISVNSFSKYWGMTGWRLGWLVLPAALVEPVERLAQNHAICASAVAQHAALACFEPTTLAACEQRRTVYAQRAQRFAAGLQALGFAVPIAPDGAFSVGADAREPMARVGAADSMAFVRQMMHEVRVVATPSTDFGQADGGRCVRFSVATADADLDEALQRLRRWLPG
ncbi:MAG: pyridoxal phosphate-dependent aminotransferase [Tepidimonas sp.]|nr:pyridoxal phosphate-dependent aminotransferase [Tepidimonas sp.]